jgi:RNA polymerase sigma factor (sigma-70 family)
MSPSNRSLNCSPCSVAEELEQHYKDSLADLYRAEGPLLLRFFQRRTRYPEDATDLLHETFSRFARASAEGVLENPAAYLQRIATNLLINRRRRAEHRAAHLPLEFVDLTDPAPSPHDQLEAREALERLDACLARMRPKTRQVFLLRRLEGLSYAQIGAQVGLSVGGVEKQMAKAMAHLDRQLGRR